MSRYTVHTITDNDLVNALQEGAGDALARQPWFVRRKNTLAAIAQAVLQLANLGVTLAVGSPVWVTFTIAAVIIAAEVVFHASTRGPVTPSAAQEILSSVDQRVRATVRQVPSGVRDSASGIAAHYRSRR